MADIDEEKVTEKSAKHIVARDGDPNWFNNPQFVRTRAEIPPPARCPLVVQGVRACLGHTCALDCRLVVVLLLLLNSARVLRQGRQVLHLPDASGQEAAGARHQCAHPVHRHSREEELQGPPVA